MIKDILRDIVLIVFAMALVSLSQFGLDIFRDILAGNGNIVSDSFHNSEPWVWVSISVLSAAFIGLIVLSIFKRREDTKRHIEIITAIQQIKDD